MKIPRSLTTVTRTSKIFALIVFFGLLYVSFWAGMRYQARNTNTVISNPDLQRVCPEAWYDDKMPPLDQRPATERQYFIIKGEGVKYSEVDIAWVKEHCKVNKPQVVY